MTTNNKDALIVESGDRRYVMFKSSGEKAKVQSYFDELKECMEDDNVVRAFYDYLMKVDLSDFSHLNRPKTELYIEMKQQSIHPIFQWIVDSEEDFIPGEGDDEDGVYKKTTEWLELFNTWNYKVNLEKLTTTAFGTAMSEFASKDCGIIKKSPGNIRKLVINRGKVVDYLANEV